jgi:hypothetical protein
MQGRNEKMKINKGRVWTLAAAAGIMLALSGCGMYAQTEYVLHPPATPEGQMCVMKCERDRKQCIDNEYLQQKNCEHHNRMVRLEFERCIASGATNCYAASAMPCPAPRVSRCATEYHHCYQSCGGTVESKEVCTGGWCL